MLWIDLKGVQAAADRLLEQVSLEEKLLEELEQIREEIKEMSFTEEVFCLLGKCMEREEEERRAFLRMSDCLKQAAKRYERVERQIADIYNLETRCFPRTSLGKSYFGDLERSRELIPIRGI